VELIPAIDIRGGRCVRLVQGDYARETVFDADPIDVARRWAAGGTTRIHVVDLDGAREGVRANRQALATSAARDGHTAVPADVIMRAVGRFRIDDPAAAVAAAVDDGTVLPFEQDEFPVDDGAVVEDAAAPGAALLALARYALA